MTESHKSKSKADLSALTHREREVLRLIAEGLSVSEISKVLYRSEKTIQSHRLSIGRKLGARNRVELARIAIEAGLVPSHPGISTAPPVSDLLSFSQASLDSASALSSASADAMLESAVLYYWSPMQKRRWFANSDHPLSALLSTYAGDGLWDYLTLVHPDDREQVHDMITAVHNGAAAQVELRYRLISPDGLTHQVHELAQPVHVDALQIAWVGVLMLE